MTKIETAQQKLDKIKAKNAARAKKFKQNKEKEGLVRISVWIPAKLKQHIHNKGYQIVIGYADVPTEQIPCLTDGSWKINPKCA